MPNTARNPITKHYEFFGTPGALAISIGLPIVCLLAYLGCNQNGCPREYSLESILDQVRTSSFISKEAVLAYLAWFGGLCVLDIIVPGTVLDGTVLRDGTKLKYKFNGPYTTAILVVTLISRWFATKGAMPELVFLYDHLLELTTVTILFSFILSLYLYLSSFINQDKKLLALGGNTGSPVYDWYIGRELNPRIGSFDLKMFCELKPGLQLWMLINVSMAHHQYLKYGYITDSMLLVNLLQGLYVIEGIYFEQGVLSMMDIIQDGFGFMLAFGDLALVPFTYTLQSRYLADHPVQIGKLGTAGVLSVFILGYWIFRASNNQKAAFKAGSESAKHLKYIASPTGSKLITSGWWGVARHINYIGDWLIALGYSLPCGFSTPIPYYYVVFFATLLIHREMRDEAKCHAKYGKTWEEYKRQVPWRIIPFLY